MRTILLLFFWTSMHFYTLKAQMPDQMPVYPGCEQAEQKMPCFKEKLLNFIAENFDSDLLQKIDDTGEVKMMITFIIDTDGSLDEVEIKSAYDSLNDEMKKVLSRVPKITPASQNGSPVRMQYELPVIFEIKKPTD